MSAPLRFVVPMPPNIANARLHWRAKNRKRTEFFDRCDWLMAAKILPAPPEKPFRRVAVEAVLHLGAAMDHDNAFSRLKWPMDWLVRRGYLVDDRASNVRWDGMPQQVVKRNQDYRIELTLTPL